MLNPLCVPLELENCQQLLSHVRLHEKQGMRGRHAQGIIAGAGALSSPHPIHMFNKV